GLDHGTGYRRRRCAAEVPAAGVALHVAYKACLGCYESTNTTEALGERSVVDSYLVLEAKVLANATTVLAEHEARVCFVHVNGGVVGLGELYNFREITEVTVH